MNLNYKLLIPENFDGQSRVWVYQSNRDFTIEELGKLQQLLDNFVVSWNSHGDKVKGFASILFNQFVILMADETAAGVSGCSTDSSVRVVKEIEQKLGVELFNRKQLAFEIAGRIELIEMTDLNDAVQTNRIDAETLYFNNTILTKNDLLNNWIVPIKKSWLLHRLNLSEVS